MFSLCAGVFLLPYCCFSMLRGLPLFLSESVIGQYTQEGPITCWTKLCPLAQNDFFVTFHLIIAGTISGISEQQTVLVSVFFQEPENNFRFGIGVNDQLTEPNRILYIKSPLNNLDSVFTKQHLETNIVLFCSYPPGAGYSMLLIQLYDRIYSLIIAWATFNLIYSFRDPLPWATCNNSWNTGLSSSILTVLCFLGFEKISIWLPYVILAILLVRGLMLPGAWQRLICYLYLDNLPHLADYQVRYIHFSKYYII